MGGEREFTGSVLRGYLACMEKDGLKAAVRERLPPDTQTVLDKPPFALSWIAARHFDAVLEAFLAVAGEKKLVQLAEDATRASMGAAVRPLMQTLMSLFGATPAVLFRHLDKSAQLFVKGASFAYEVAGECEGVLRITTVDRAPRAFWVQWTGVLRFGFEVASAQGSIDPCEIDTDGRGATYRVSWS
jgi:hypothetical protein